MEILPNLTIRNISTHLIIEKKGEEDDIFNIDLSMIEVSEVKSQPGPSAGQACSASCVSCQRTCGQCKSEQVRC